LQLFYFTCNHGLTDHQGIGFLSGTAQKKIDFIRVILSAASPWLRRKYIRQMAPLTTSANCVANEYKKPVQRCSSTQNRATRYLSVSASRLEQPAPCHLIWNGRCH